MMEINQVRKIKNEMTTKIINMLDDFEDKTGLVVSKVDYTREYMALFGTTTSKLSLKIYTDLEY